MSRIGPRRPIRPAGRAVPSLARAFAGEAPIHLLAPAGALVVVASFTLAYVIALTSGGPDAVVLLGAPLYAAALLLSGGPALVAGALIVAFTIPLARPARIAARRDPGIRRGPDRRGLGGRPAGGRRAGRRPPGRTISTTRRDSPSSGPPSSASSRRRRAGSAGPAPSRRSGGRSSRRRGRIIDYHNARVYVLEPGGDVVPIAFEGMVGAYEQVDFDLLRCRVGEGFTGWVAEHGVPILVGDANVDPRGATIPGTDDVDESMLVVPMAYDGVTVGVITLSKLGLDQFDAEDERLLLILADQAATAIETARLLARSQALAGELRRLLDMSGELSASLDSRQVANLIARHLASAMGVDECAISYWDRRAAIASRRSATTRRCQSRTLAAVLRPRRVPGDPARAGRPGDARRRCRRPGRRSRGGGAARSRRLPLLVMLPLVAKGESIGLVELISRSPIAISDQEPLSSSPGRWPTRPRWPSRTPASTRTPGPSQTATRSPASTTTATLHERFGEEVVRAQRCTAPAQRADARPRRLQARQRHVRPPVRRPGAGVDGRGHPLDAPGVGHSGPLRRRRVRDPPARHGTRRRRTRRRANPARRLPPPRSRTAGAARSRSGSPLAPRRSRPTAGAPRS